MSFSFQTIVDAMAGKNGSIPAIPDSERDSLSAEVIIG